MATRRIPAVIAWLVTVSLGVVGCGGEDVGSTYSADKVTRACDLVDLSVLDKWESTPGEREENKETTLVGTEFHCDVTTKSTTEAKGAGLMISATIHNSRSEARSSYEMIERFADDPGSTDSIGAVPDLGERAFFAWRKNEYSASSMFNQVSSLEISMHDGHLEIHLILGIAAAYDQDEVMAIATTQVRGAMDKLRA